MLGGRFFSAYLSSMGIIIQDTITLASGLEVQKAYAGFANNLLTVTPVASASSSTGKLYNVQAPYCIWVSDDCRRAGNDPLVTRQLSFQVGPDELNDGVYALLYGQLCGQYTDVTNTDRPAGPAQQQASTPAPSSSSSAPAASPSSS